MTDDLRACCPECGSLQISKRVRGHGYYCNHRHCGASFETPDEREPKHTGGRLPTGVGQALLDADPEEFP